MSSPSTQIPPVKQDGPEVDSRGMPLSPRQLEIQAYFRSIIQRRKPTLNLPPEHELTKINRNPPRLMYGFQLSREQIFAYAQSRQLPPTNPSLGPLTAQRCLFPTLKRLRELTDEPWLCFSPSFPPGQPEMFVVTLYTNYTIDVLQCEEEDEKDIIRILRQELGIDEQ
ncbi:hypothetical protein BV25DRAFT_1922800, partial [Artomyces pyxidatus]